ncbi:hypothetical protein ACQY0O_008398 [Thecaphora frezii]
MFVATTLYNYATARGDSTSRSPQPTKDNRVRRRSRHSGGRPVTPPPSYESATGEKAADGPRQHNGEGISPQLREKLDLLEALCVEEDLYKVLDVKRNAKPEEIRRAFLNRSRVCHPDKFPSYPASTIAFQKVALAYETLSKPSSRRMYDVSGRSDFAAAVNTAEDGAFGGGMPGFGEETLNNVLYSIMCEFLEGDFDMIRVLVQAMNESNSGIQMGSDTVESLEGAFRKVREMLLAGKRYVRVVHLELIRLYEIQQHLRSLSYFDVFGRLRLTIQLARVTLSIPMAIDQAMKTSCDDDTDSRSDPDGNDAEHYSSPEDSTDDEADHGAVHLFEGEEQFGIALEGSLDAGDDEVRAARSRRRAARARRRAREAAGRHNLEAGHERRRSSSPSTTPSASGSALQQKGLLGPTASGLLMGIIKVLEASESWVPGQSGRSGEPSR